MIFKRCSTCNEARPDSVFPDGGETCKGCVDRANKAPAKPAKNKRRRHWKKAFAPEPDRRGLDRELYRAVWGCEPPESHR